MTEPLTGVEQLKFHLFARTLHPELFRILDQREVWRDDYRAQFWIVEGGHVVTLQSHDKTLCEAILVHSHDLPVQRRLARFSFAHNPQKRFRYDDGIAVDARFDFQQFDPVEFPAQEHVIHRAIVRNGFYVRFDVPGCAVPAVSAIGYSILGRVLSVKTWHTFPAQNSVLSTHTRWEVRY